MCVYGSLYTCCIAFFLHPIYVVFRFGYAASSWFSSHLCRTWRVSISYFRHPIYVVFRFAQLLFTALFIPYMSLFAKTPSNSLIPSMSYSSHIRRTWCKTSSHIRPSKSVFHPIDVVLHPIYVAFQSLYIKAFKNLYNTYYTHRTTKAVWLC